MLKVTIKGQVYSFDQRYALHEAIEIEDAAGVSFGRYQEMLKTGSARGVAIFAWVVLRRNGVDVPLDDIMSGRYPLDNEDIAVDAEGEPEPGKAESSDGHPSLTPTSGGGSPPSPGSTGTPRHRSASSPSTSSTT